MGREKISINMDSLKSRKDYKRFKLQDGANIYRILPPFGDAEVHKGYPFRKWSTAWLIDPQTGKLRPFATPQTEGKDCPVRDYSDLLAKKLKEVEAKLIQKGLNDDQIATKMEGLRKAQWQIRVNHTYAYNASNKEGEVGILEVKSTAHKGIKTLMMAYITEYSQDPTSLDSDTAENAGVWFNINKTGKNKDTTYTVTLNQAREKSSDGKVYKVDDRSPLAENIVDSYEDLGYDLNAIYVRKTYDEMKTILLHNLALLAETYPEVVLPGYDISDIQVKAAPAKETASLEDDEDEVVAAPVAKKKAVVAIKLDDLDDEDDFEVAPVVKKAAAPVAKPKAKSAFDAMAMADEILGE